MLDHPRSAIVGISSVLKFGLDRCIVLEILRFLYFAVFGLKLPIHAHFCRVLGAYFPQMMSPTVLSPTRHFLTWNHVVWAIMCENRFSGSTWARFWEKKDRTGQDSQTKKSQSGNILPICESPHCTDWNQKFCVVGHLAEVITYAKFQVEIFRGCDFTGGRISHFPIDFLDGPYNSAARLRCLWLKIWCITLYVNMAVSGTGWFHA